MSPYNHCFLCLHKCYMNVLLFQNSPKDTAPIKDNLQAPALLKTKGITGTLFSWYEGQTHTLRVVTYIYNMVYTVCICLRELCSSVCSYELPAWIRLRVERTAAN